MNSFLQLLVTQTATRNKLLSHCSFLWWLFRELYWWCGPCERWIFLNFFELFEFHVIFTVYPCPSFVFLLPASTKSKRPPCFIYILSYLFFFYFRFFSSSYSQHLCPKLLQLIQYGWVFNWGDFWVGIGPISDNGILNWNLMLCNLLFGIFYTGYDPSLRHLTHVCDRCFDLMLFISVEQYTSCKLLSVRDLYPLSIFCCESLDC